MNGFATWVSDTNLLAESILGRGLLAALGSRWAITRTRLLAEHLVRSWLLGTELLAEIWRSTISRSATHTRLLDGHVLGTSGLGRKLLAALWASSSSSADSSYQWPWLVGANLVDY